MMGALTGFAVIGVAIVLGYIVGRTGILGPHAKFVLSRLVFFVLAPFLLFTVLATADTRVLFSNLLPVSALAAFAAAAIFALVAVFAWRRSLGHVTVGALASGYVNGNNIGLPIATYMLGNAAFAAPIVLLQLLVLTPIGLAILDAAANGKSSVGRILLQTARNPLIIGSLLGVVVSLTGVTLPTIVFDPIYLVGQACIPVMLISFGMSLPGQKLLAPGSGRRDVVLATALKLVAMPLIAWALGAFVFNLSAEALYVVVVLAALPSAQNVFNYAQRYDTAEILARDTVFITTIGAVPVLFIVSLLLA